MPHARPLLATLVLGLSISAACLPGAMPPRVPPRSTLSLGEDAPRATAAASGPLTVVFAAPRGETTEAAEIGVVLSKPMRALGLGPSDPPPPISIRPAAKGAFHWVGSTTLRFDAEEPLAPGTTYSVEIPAGTRALDGTALAEPFVLAFTTPRVAAIACDPAEGTRDVAPNADIRLQLNQTVSDAEIARAVTIRGERAAAPIPFTIHRRPDGWIELVHAKPLPLADRVHVRVDATLRGDRGDLPSGKERDFAFHTAVPPSIVRWSCDPHPDDASVCDPSGANVTVELSGEVDHDLLTKAVVIEPKVEWTPPEPYSYRTKELSIRASFKPGTSYRVRLAPGPKLVDEWGQRLTVDAGRTFQFGHEPGRATLGLGGIYWSAKASHAFSTWTVNTSRAEFHAVPRSLDEVLRSLDGDAPFTPCKAGVPLAERALDESVSTPIRLDDLLPGARGAIDLVAAYTPRGLADRRATVRRVQITDLAVSALVGHGSAAVLVTDIDDARAAPGAAVELYRVPKGGAPERLGSAIAGSLGEAALHFDRAIEKTDALAVVAKRGNDWTLRTIATPRPTENIGVLFTERGIYRPGETVKLTGVFRAARPSGLAVPQDRKVHVLVKGNRDEAIIDRDVALSDFGTLSVDVPIPKEASVGTFRVEAKLGEGRTWGRFHVAEYRPTEIAVEAAMDHATRTRGEALRCQIQGKYLHGGVMAGSMASIVVTRSPTWFEVAHLEGFSIRDFEGDSRGGEIARDRRKLDAGGAAAFPISLALPGQTGPESVSCAAEVMDLNRQALAAAASALVHPGELYVALSNPPSPTPRPGGTLRLGLLALTPQGERREARVHVEATRRERGSGKPETPAGACDVTTGAAPAACVIAIPADASEETNIVVRATVKDAKGNVARASRAYGIELPPKLPKRAPSPPPPPSSPPEKQLRLTTAREQKVGATGHIAIESPFAVPATAMVTIEREGILWQRVVTVPPSGTSLDFMVTEAMIPNAHVGVSMISGKSARYDWTSIEVDPAPRRLTVDLEVEGGAAHRPGEAIDVSVRVKDAQGKPARAEITLWSADDASLSLIYYSVPNVHDRLFGWRNALVTKADSRDDLLRVGRWGSHRSKPPSVRMGATSVSPPRGDFKQTAFYAAHLVTDDAGRLRQRFTLPDGLTTYRVMAVAVTADDRTGTQETKVTTSLPLMARATLPRIVRVGDRFEASVVVSAEAGGEAVVTAEASGVTLAGAATAKVSLTPGAPAETRFSVRADRAGAAQLTFRATQGKLTDAMTLAREVMTPMVPESAAIDGQTSDAAAEALGDLSAIRPDFGGLEVSLSTTPLAGLADGIEQLIQYPYGCTEQTVSRLVPLLALRDLAESLGASLPGKASTAVTESVAKLLTHQRKDGGFGLWRESAHSTPWLTAWAMWGLGEARRRGSSVPASVETRAWAYLKEAMSTARDAPPEKLALAAFAADLAALDGKADTALGAQLFAVRDRLPPFSRGLLLHAMALGKGDPARVHELAGEIENLVRLDGAAARVVMEHPIDPYDSDTRATALLLRGLIAADARHPLVPRLARGLIESRRHGRFRNTHDAAWALLALDDLRRAEKRATDETVARVFLGEALLREATLRDAKPVAFGIPASALIGSGTRPLAFTTDGPLHYHARLTFARRALPTLPVEAGMFLRRSIVPLDRPDPPLAEGSFAAGTLVAVRLDLASPSPRSALVIESPLPSGLEPVDADLRLGGAWLRALEHDGAAVRREIRDDRVVYFVDDLPAGVTSYRFVARASTPGTFIAPPARAEEMYAPDTFARTAAETITILSR